MNTITTYILFDGTCDRAMKFYQSCLGGELTISTVAESAMKDHMPLTLRDKVLNARLKADGIDLSASDWMRPDQKPIRGNTVCLYVSGQTHEEVEKLFARLAEGAEITDPLKAMWFGTYGALNDQFGVRWMFHTDNPV